MQGGSRIGAEFHEASRDGERARDLSRRCDLGRFTDVEKQHVGLANQFLRFIRTDTRHLGFGLGQHRLYSFHFILLPDQDAAVGIGGE